MEYGCSVGAAHFIIFSFRVSQLCIQPPRNVCLCRVRFDVSSNLSSRRRVDMIASRRHCCKTKNFSKKWCMVAARLSWIAQWFASSNLSMWTSHTNLLPSLTQNLVFLAHFNVHTQPATSKSISHACINRCRLHVSCSITSGRCN